MSKLSTIFVSQLRNIILQQNHNMSLNLIARHLDRANLKFKVHQIDTLCAFEGVSIQEGVKVQDLVSDVFTDYNFVRYNTGFVGVDAAMCIADVLKGATRNVALRNYSYLATESSLTILKREDGLNALLNIPSAPFRVAISYSQKKHTTFKTVLNSDKNNYVVTTDLYNVAFERDHVMQFLPIIQNWYSVIPEKATTAAQPTFFTKDEILNGNAPYHKQLPYGLERYERENETLLPFRNTQILKLIVHLLNKK